MGIIYTIVFSAILFKILTSRRQISFGPALRDSPGSAVSFAIGVIIVWPVMALLAYHLRVSHTCAAFKSWNNGVDPSCFFKLMFLGSTTIEQVSHAQNPSPCVLHDLVLNSLLTARFENRNPATLSPSTRSKRPHPMSFPTVRTSSTSFTRHVDLKRLVGWMRVGMSGWMRDRSIQG